MPGSTGTRPNLTSEKWGNVPEELRALPQWVGWKFKKLKGAPKPTKIPVNVRTGGAGKSDDPSTWCNFQTAVEGYKKRKLSGIGFVFCEDDPYCGIDLDDCVENGKFVNGAEKVVAGFNSYSEISPSGTGVKIIIKGVLSGDRNRKGKVEMYDRLRYFTVTGDRLGDVSPHVEERQAVLDRFYAKTFTGEKKKADPDKQIITKVKRKAAKLWKGDFSDYTSQNEADFALCNYIRAAGGTTHAQIDRIFRQSGLMREKWERSDYSTNTIKKALDYSPGIGSYDAVREKYTLSRHRTRPTAKIFLQVFYTVSGKQSLIYWNDDFYRWAGNHYQKTDDGMVKAQMLKWLDEDAQMYGKGQQLIPFSANDKTVNSAINTVKIVNPVAGEIKPPTWFSSCDADPTEIVTCKSNNFNLRTGEITPGTPDLFVLSALPFDFDADAPRPTGWLDFLAQLLPDDPQAVELLQEWFGYCLTPDTSQQKMLLIIGPKRAGKGTIGRILRQLIGESNVSNPTVSRLADSFGLEDLMGTRLAQVTDARFKGRDMDTVVERLKAISGEDAIAINRKHQKAVHMKLPTRFMVLSNETPQLSDVSGALASRFVVIRLRESFIGREERGLIDRLLPELPGILLWAVEGWRRLQARGHFVEPKSSAEDREILEATLSPMSAFVDEMCVLNPGLSVGTDKIREAYRLWRENRGLKPVHLTKFGIDINAVCAKVKYVKHKKLYVGIGLAS